MARRAAGEGNIRKRADGRWEGRYVAGHDAEGKPIRKNVLGKTQAEVKEKLKAALEECQRLDVSRADDFTVESWMRLWYETYSKPNIREATQERYWNHIQYHIIPEIGSIKLNKLTGRQVQTMYNNVRDHGRVKKGPNDKRNPSLSASYIRSLHRMLHMALERAEKEQLILRNPCDDVILPREEKREMKTLKPENFKAYLEEAERRGVRPMMFLELCSGLRKGELVALLWSDLDVENKTISVSKQAVRVKGGGVKVTTPKTATSIRVESIPQEAVDLLVEEHEKHPDNPYMFPSPVTGGMYYPDAVNAINKKILKTLGLEPIRFHDLRHTFATTALQSGVDIRTVSGMLGHADPGFTLRTYPFAHTSNPMQVKAAETIGNEKVRCAMITANECASIHLLKKPSGGFYMASLILCKTINWTAVSAIGQIMCAIATFLAVVVALMPYKRKVKVGLTSVKIDHDDINILVNVVLENCGETTLRIKEWGIKGASFEVQLGADQIILEPREVKRIQINQSCFREAIGLEKSSMFSVYAIDSGENIFCSKKYKSSDFFGGWDRPDWFK